MACVTDIRVISKSSYIGRGKTIFEVTYDDGSLESLSTWEKQLDNIKRGVYTTENTVITVDGYNPYFETDLNSANTLTIDTSEQYDVPVLLGAIAKYTVKAKLLGLQNTNVYAIKNGRIHLMEVLNASDVFIPDFVHSAKLDNIQTKPFNKCNRPELTVSGAFGMVDMSGLFSDCPPELTVLTLKEFGSSKCTRTSDMFRNSGFVVISLGEFVTSGIRTAYNMFRECSRLCEIDIEFRDFSSLENAYAMFRGCEKLEYLDLSECDFGKLKYFDFFVYGCSRLKDLNIAGIDVEKLNTAYFWNKSVSSGIVTYKNPTDEHRLLELYDFSKRGV